MREAFAGLTPEPLWKYFDALSQIPRSSGNEAAARAFVIAEGEKRQLTIRQDKVGNVVLVVPAKMGCERAPTIVLQGHLDMVCEKNGDVVHDFAKDPIHILRDGDWLKAKGTTLGGDNGIGVAAALALLDDPPARHGKLELLFTIDEETGLTGATNIESHMLEGKLLLNLDSEDEGQVTVGCAGGCDTAWVVNAKREPAPNTARFALNIGGLTGGHSGIEIIFNRANSLRALGRVLDRALALMPEMRLVTLDGGSKRNAIPREATAVVALPSAAKGKLEAAANEIGALLSAEFNATDPELKVSVEVVSDNAAPMCAADSNRIVALLVAAPTGVLSMSRDIPGLVETSTNLGVVTTQGDTVRFVHCSRSAVEAAKRGVQQTLRALGEAAGAKVEGEGGYPGWKPNLASPLLASFKKIHQEVTGKAPEVVALHAGLECGILGERFLGMDMISFGPDIRGAHSPAERLSIPSAQKVFMLLKRVIEAQA